MEGSNNEAFPAADVNNELNPGNNTSVEVDPVSSQVAENVEKQKRAKEAKKHREEGRNETLQTFKNAIIVSGVLIAVAGAVFAITKKLKENKA